MHKFTIFTIILSAVVILLTAELVVNDYWDSEAESMQASVLTVEGEPKIDEEIEQDIVEEPIEEALPYFEETFLQEIGLLEPRTLEEPFAGLIYGFWDLSESLNGIEVEVVSLFDGPDFLGTLYVLPTENEIQTFGVYEALRKSAQTSDKGEINETNMYGDESFYFNHHAKTSTVFLTVRKDSMIYAMQYEPEIHEPIRRLIERI